MAQTGLITIIIPVYNRRDLITRTLDSIAAQDYRPLNVIVVDNNSSDDSYNVVDRWISKNQSDNLRLTLLSESKPGAPAARNRGLMNATTPWVMFFDSDDTMRQNHISRAVNAILKNPTADIIGWDSLLHRRNGATKILRFHARHQMFNHLFHASLATIRYTAKTDFIRKAGGWDEDVKGWNDYVLGVRLLVNNPRMVYSGSEITTDIYEQSESITGRSFSEKRGNWEYSLDRCEIILSKPGLSHNIRWIEARRAIVAGHYTAEGNPAGIEDLKKLQRNQSSKYRRWALKQIHNHVAKRRRGTAILCFLLLYMR